MIASRPTLDLERDLVAALSGNHPRQGCHPGLKTLINEPITKPGQSGATCTFVSGPAPIRGASLQETAASPLISVFSDYVFINHGYDDDN